MAASKKERLLKRNTMLKIDDRDMEQLLTILANTSTALFHAVSEQFEEQKKLKKHQQGMSQFIGNRVVKN